MTTLLGLSAEEKSLLLRMGKGVKKLEVFRYGLYPGTVSIELLSGQCLMLGARGVDLAERFEVFPIFVAESKVSREPDQIIEIPEFSSGCSVEILEKAEWALPSSDDEKKHMQGNPDGASTQYEGKPSEVPLSALHSAVLQAGVELAAPQGRRVQIATSMFPFALYVSDCDFSEAVPVDLYGRVAVCR